jgi:hypothetical protein
LRRTGRAVRLPVRNAGGSSFEALPVCTSGRMGSRSCPARTQIETLCRASDWR